MFNRNTENDTPKNRGAARCSIGSSPMAIYASVSCDNTLLANSVAIAVADRAITIIAVKSGPNSRTITVISKGYSIDNREKLCNTGIPSHAIAAPDPKLNRNVIHNASTNVNNT
jgi:hypothetical protein